eukprot:SAG31_NODE_32740_length_352_cov_0.762846_1_plen_22_part_10
MLTTGLNRSIRIDVEWRNQIRV